MFLVWRECDQLSLCCSLCIVLQKSNKDWLPTNNCLRKLDMFCRFWLCCWSLYKQNGLFFKHCTHLNQAYRGYLYYPSKFCPPRHLHKGHGQDCNQTGQTFPLWNCVDEGGFGQWRFTPVWVETLIFPLPKFPIREQRENLIKPPSST